MKDGFEIKRSPAKVCWWILFNKVIITTADTKREAEERVLELEKVMS